MFYCELNTVVVPLLHTLYTNIVALVGSKLKNHTGIFGMDPLFVLQRLSLIVKVN